MKNNFSLLFKAVLFPFFFYFISLCILTYPLILKFSTHLFSDTADGLQNLWNIWWINKSVTQLHQSPLHTNYLHYPFGISLIGHTLNPFNGFIGIFLLKFLSMYQTYNFIFIFSFVLNGLTSFYLSYYLLEKNICFADMSKSYWGSIIGGFIFAFSSYNFHNAFGHLQLISLEWFPLFILCWYVLVTRPSIIMGIVSALVLFLVILCDYYYFFYSVLISMMIFIWYVTYKRGFSFFLEKNYWASFTAFFLTTCVTTAPIVIYFLFSNSKDPFVGAHQAKEFSLDLLGSFFCGKYWRFAYLTKFYWGHLSDGENRFHIGFSVTYLIVYTWLNRKRIRIQSVRLWYFILIFAFVMSMGPILHILGREISSVKLPYIIFEKLFPFVQLSGMPVRMMAVVMLISSIICAAGFSMLFESGQKKRVLAIVLLVILFLEYLPRHLPASHISVPKYVEVLKNLPNKEGIIDLATRVLGLPLYYQTIHEKPMSKGYVARIPQSVCTKIIILDKRIAQIFYEDKGYDSLYRDYKFRYLIISSVVGTNDEYLRSKLFYEDKQVKIYDFGK